MTKKGRADSDYQPFWNGSVPHDRGDPKVVANLRKRRADGDAFQAIDDAEGDWRKA